MAIRQRQDVRKANMQVGVGVPSSRRVEVTVLVTAWDHGFDLFVLDSAAGLLFREQVDDRAAVEPAVRARLRAERPDRADATLVIIGP